MSNFISYEAVQKFTDSFDRDSLEDKLKECGVVDPTDALEHFSKYANDSVTPVIINREDSVSLFYSAQNSYLSVDENPLGDDSYAKFTEFKSKESRDNYLSSKSSKKYLLLDKYAHGSVHYSVSDSVSYPDSRWDVSFGCSVLELGDDLVGLRKALVKKHGDDGEKKFLEHVNGVLDRYSSYLNGHCEDLYEVIVPKHDSCIEVNSLGIFFTSEDLKAEFANSVFSEISASRINEIENEINVDDSKENLKGFENNIMKKGSTKIEVFKHTTEDGIDSKMAVVSFEDKVVSYVNAPGGFYFHLQPKNERQVSEKMSVFTRNNNIKNFALNIAASEFMENALRYDVENSKSSYKLG